MIARVLRVEVGTDQVDAVVDTYRDVVRPVHAQARGLLHHYVMTDKTKGVVAFIGVWESSDAVAAIAPALEPARAKLWAHFGRDPEIEVYEIVDELVGR
jgi:quinol monooxygenase YgiN